VLGHDLQFHKVLQVIQRICDEPVYEFKTEKGSTFLTGEHPIYTDTNVWKTVKDIDLRKDGCCLCKDNLKFSKIKSITQIPYNNYLCNLEVEDCHSFVADNIMMHNSSFTWNSPS